MKRFISFIILFAAVSASCYAQDTLASYKLNLVQHPVSKLYGYAFKEQNIMSPIHGASATAVNLIGSGGSVLIGKKDAEYIDWAVPAQYEDASNKFKENVAMVKVGGKVGFIDLFNRFVIPPSFDGDTDIDGFHEGLAAVMKNGKYGYIDKCGRTVIPFIYDKADNFDEDYIAAVKHNGMWGAINIKGEIVVKAEYKSKATLKTLPTSNKAWREAVKLTREKKNNGAFEQFMTGIRAVAAKLNSRIIQRTKERLTYKIIGTGDSIGMKDQYGRIIIPQNFNSIRQDIATQAFIVKKNGKYGLYTYNGGRVVGTCFDTMKNSAGGRFSVSIYGVNGWINAKGELSSNLLSDLCKKGTEVRYTDAKKAVDIYNTTLSINPECATAYNNLALIDFDNRDYNKGMRKLKLAVKLEPGNETIKKNLDQAKSERKERRNERWDMGLTIATAVITLGTTAYSTYSAVSGKGSVGDVSSGGSSGGGSGRSGHSGTGKCKYCAGTGTCSASSYVSRKKACSGNGHCGYCNGNGWNSAGGDRAKCMACNGTGKCSTCGGTGKCKYCKGSGK